MPNLKSFEHAQEANDLGALRYYLEVAKQQGFQTKSSQVFLDIQDLDSSNSYMDKTYNFLLGAPIEYYCFISLFFIFLACFLFKKLYKRIILIVLSFFIMGFAYIYKEKYFFAVAAYDLDILDGPSSVFRPIGKISEGAKFIVAKEYNKWHQVKAPFFFSGYVAHEDIYILPKD